MDTLRRQEQDLGNHASIHLGNGDEEDQKPGDQADQSVGKEKERVASKEPEVRVDPPLEEEEEEHKEVVGRKEEQFFPLGKGGGGKKEVRTAGLTPCSSRTSNKVGLLRHLTPAQNQMVQRNGHVLNLL